MLLDVLSRLKLRMLGSLQPAMFWCIERLLRRRLKPQRGPFLARSSRLLCTASSGAQASSPSPSSKPSAATSGSFRCSARSTPLPARRA